MVSGIGPKTRVLGLIGYPVEHSLSPAMINAAVDKLQLNMVYVPLATDPAELPAAIAGIRAMGMAGVNVTIPHKEAVIPCLDSISNEARIIGAVNTIVNQNGVLTGHNTDGKGFLMALAEAGFRIEGKRVVVLGAGGAARAVAVTCALGGAAEVIILNRTLTKARAIVSYIRHTTGVKSVAFEPDAGEVREMFTGVDLVVNATPVGMWPDVDRMPPIDPGLFHPGLCACDLIYNPVRTRFLMEAERIGCRVVPGLGMLVYQGALAFQMWTGLPAPVDLMMDVVRRELGV